MNLTAKNPNEQAVLDYLEANASPELKAKIDAEGKTLAGCWAYITSFAKSKIALKDRHGEKCVHLSPEEVYGTAIHYFEDEKEGAIFKSDEELREEAENKEREEKRRIEREAKRKEEAEKEAARLAALTPEQRAAEEAAKADAAAKEAAERQEREERAKREKEEAKRITAEAYAAVKEGKDYPDQPDWSYTLKAAAKEGRKRAKDELAEIRKKEREARAAERAAKAEAKAKAASAQMSLFDFI